MKQELISILKTNAPITFAWICFILGWVLVILAFFTPPMGTVDQSILWIFGQALIFTGSAIGLDLSYNNKLNNFKHEMKRDFDNFRHGKDSIEEEYKDYDQE